MRCSFNIFVLIALGSAFSCSEEFKPTPYTYTKLFTGENNKTWKIKLIEVTLDGEVVNRYMEDCLKDDSFVFYANAEHSFQAFSGSTKCFGNPPEPDLVVDAWSFNNATSALIMVIPYVNDSPVPYLVREVDKDDMILEIFLNQENTQSGRIYFEATDEE